MKNYLMDTYNRKNVSFTKGKGVYLWDTDDNKYLDALCGLAVTSLGHSDPDISYVISKQSETLIHTSNAFMIQQQEQLGEKLCKLSGMQSAFFCNSGAEAVEASIKIARKYGNDKKINNPKIIVMENSFHGRTMAALSATGGGKAHKGFHPLLDGLLRVPYNDVDAIKILSKKHKDIVAILLEPIQGEGGIIIPDRSYLKELRIICDKFKWLLMIDEVQSGFCRTGKWFGFQHSSIIPDVISVAKALGNGVPIGACLASNDAAKVLVPGSHGSTFGGNFLSTSVGLEVLNIMKKKSLCKNARDMGVYLESELNKKLAHLDIIKEIRCIGLMIGIELKVNCMHLAQNALENRLVINVTKENTIRMLPPLILNKEQADVIVTTLEKIIGEIKYE
ncbi:MAG: aspartate aminotransferase family protein [Gammaproteobacteria bacterium]|nr:aspartate aminotransferase family protein [Gammaproteobacteria bacterium]MBT4462910.1 aspartate aminotransferase family protein [Gammaproteobacteria bacterium]MBT4654667.1 aspartate aminotransferase family protein [Gammaproteobacteria bacterium]MBT5116346.1 aspartate aminotransferase family protein [Gammaproteobacteria bacterium]MBT5761353.1 aspartate aminotransferase family protein [Gammaproteobacteria bacterium]